MGNQETIMYNMGLLCTILILQAICDNKGKGLIMVPRRVLVSGPITALAAASPRWKVTIFGRRTPGPGSGRKEGP